MAVMCAWASVNVLGKVNGGKAGDLTGKEVKCGRIYNFGLTRVYRCKNRNKAVRIGAAAKGMATNYLMIVNGSFYDMLLGNPRDNTSYGCMSQPIVNAANKYFKVNNMSAVAKNISGTDFKEILGMVAQGDPIVIWNTIDMRQPYESKTYVFNGKEYTWMSPEHCVVITGYDLNKNIVYIMDPMEGNITRNLETFQSRYEEMHSQAGYIIE